MKKLLFIIAIFAGLVFSAQAQDFTLKASNDEPVKIQTAFAMGSAGADTVDIKLEKWGGYSANYSLQTVAANVSGTTEVWPILYRSNNNSDWVVIPAVAGDTLISGTMSIIKEDTDGFNTRYLRIIWTGKTQSQSTTLNSWIYVNKSK